jgi:hypothetical protein
MLVLMQGNNSPIPIGEYLDHLPTSLGQRSNIIVNRGQLHLCMLMDHKRITARAHLKSANQGGHKT